MALVAVVCHEVYPFSLTALLANVHCKELLALFKVSDIWYTNNTGPSLKRLSSCCGSHGDPVAMVPHNQSLHALKQIIDRIDVGGGQLKALMWAWVVAELVSQGFHRDHQTQARGWLCIPHPTGASSPGEEGTVLLLRQLAKSQLSHCRQR